MLPTIRGKQDYMQGTELEHTSAWLALNGGYMYTLVDSKRGDEFLKSRFGNTSDIFRTYDNLHDVGMRSDFLGYLLLEAEGGIYTETDTIALKSIDSWIPSHLRDNTRLVIGIEYDQRDGMPWEDVPHPLQFAQWTIASEPGHPVLNMMVARVVTSVKDLARRHGVREIELRPTSFEVMNSTGPAAWTEVVFEYLQSLNPDLTDTMSFSYLERPTLCGDVLILPIDGFGMGQRHSGSTDDGSIPEAALVRHLFAD
ncbi:hypothetical protein ColTof4_01202 [Colletotrichum tofieldiae]|nr:hypothetical protein ColTof3_08433 [Colletotrichum tofieldiae]GKT68779.1 hypothetical protein ColTof4_01202 [Colletotrichum tofieldiae]